MAREMILKRCRCEGANGRERFGNDWVENLARGIVYQADYRESGNPLERAFRIVVMREHVETSR